MSEYKQITKEDLHIPESLNQWFLDQGWNDDYWMEIPLTWESWTDSELKQYPITNEIVQWHKHNHI